MQYAEDFELPEEHRIITTRDHPFCPDLEPCLERAIANNLLEEVDEADVAVICRDNTIEPPAEWVPNYNIYVARVRVRRILFNVISDIIGEYQWQNGFITDHGLLHGGMAHRLYNIPSTQAVAVFGCYIRKYAAGDLITTAGLSAQNRKMKGRFADDVMEHNQGAWRDGFHRFRKGMQSITHDE